MHTEPPVHILLVDDRPENLLTLESILGELGHNLVQARSGVEALRYLLRQDFALILLDVQMPDMDGFETAKLIRSRDRSRHTPIIFLTALDRSDMNVFQGYSVGAVDVMFKPFVPEILRYKVSVFVDLYKKTMQIQGHADQLEQRVEQRTQELTHLNDILRDEILERERVEESLRVILMLSTTLASSLNLNEVMAHICDVSVPTIAEACIVDLLDSELGPHQTSIKHIDPNRQGLLQKLLDQYPIDELFIAHSQHSLDPPEAVRLVEMNAHPQMKPAAQVIWNDVHLAALLAIPLEIEKTVVGTIYLLYSQHERVYAESNVVLAAELGKRASMALEHSWLYHTAREALKARDQFLSVASHELKTPITTVLGYAQLLERRLQRETEQNPRNLKALNTLVEQCQRLDRLIRALLDLSRIQMGQFTLEYARFDVLGFMYSIVDELQPLVQKHELRLHTDAAGDELWLVGDELRLAQVFQNLIQNAVKYSPHGGGVDVVVESEEHGVAISVKDEGLGIPAEAIPLLFDRFYRANNIDAEVSGMGLGLYVVREIVSLHQGAISVESIENEGSTFRVFLPYQHDLSVDVDLSQSLFEDHS